MSCNLKRNKNFSQFKYPKTIYKQHPKPKVNTESILLTFERNETSRETGESNKKYTEDTNHTTKLMSTMTTINIIKALR